MHLPLRLLPLAALLLLLLRPPRAAALKPALEALDDAAWRNVSVVCGQRAAECGYHATRCIRAAADVRPLSPAFSSFFFVCSMPKRAGARRRRAGASRAAGRHCALLTRNAQFVLSDTCRCYAEHARCLAQVECANATALRVARAEFAADWCVGPHTSMAV